MTKEELLALKAVIHGCETNSKLEDATYINRKTREKISFCDAIDIVWDMICSEEESNAN